MQTADWRKTIVFRVRKQWDYLSRTHLHGENSSPLPTFYTDQYINASFCLLNIVNVKKIFRIFYWQKNKASKIE